MNDGKDGFGGKQSEKFGGESEQGQGGGKGEELRDKLADEYGQGAEQEVGQGGKDESLREKLEQQYSPDETGSGAKGEDSPFFGKGEGKDAFGGSGAGDDKFGGSKGQSGNEDKFGGSKGQFDSESSGDSPDLDKGGIDGEKGGGRY